MLQQTAQAACLGSRRLWRVGLTVLLSLCRLLRLSRLLRLHFLPLLLLLQQLLALQHLCCAASAARLEQAFGYRSLNAQQTAARFTVSRQSPNKFHQVLTVSLQHVETWPNPRCSPAVQPLWWRHPCPCRPWLQQTPGAALRSPCAAALALRAAAALACSRHRAPPRSLRRLKTPMRPWLRRSQRQRASVPVRSPWGRSAQCPPPGRRQRRHPGSCCRLQRRIQANNLKNAD